LTKGIWARLLWVILIGLWVFDLAWFDLSPVRLRQWLAPQPVLSLAGLVVGFIVLSWQLERQHNNALEANRRQSQDRLKVDLYTEIAERIEATGTPLVEIGGLPTAFVGELIVRGAFERGQVPRSNYFPHLRAKQNAAFHSILSLMWILETHEIVMPEFAVFRQRLAQGNNTISVALNDFAAAALQFSGPAPLRWPPTDDERKTLSSLADSASRATFALSAVVWDLRVEAQNHLLGGLFPSRRVPARTPGDPSERVTTIPAPSD
jgi:hypothetical protein